MGKEKTTFFNAIRNVGGEIYMLSNDHVIKGKFLSFSERLTTLANRGEWLEALCLGLELDTEVET